MSRLGVALIGAGQWGGNYVATLAGMPEFALRVVCDRDGAARAGVMARYAAAGGQGTVATVAELGDVRLDNGIDVVIVATPAALHVSHALAALGAGKDVLIEKPVAQSLAELEALAAAADAAAPSARICMAGHLMRFAPAFRQLVAVVRDGLIGDVVHCEIERSTDGGVRADEDVVWSLGTHDLSLLQAVMGGPPRAVEASNVAMDRATGTLTQVALRMEYGLNGASAAGAAGPAKTATARLFVSRLTGKRVRTWGVRGTRGQLAVVADERGALTTLYAAMDAAAVAASAAAPTPAPTPAWQPLPTAQAGGDTPLRLQLAHFARAVITRVPPLTDLREARLVTEAALAAREAALAAYAKTWPA